MKSLKLALVAIVSAGAAAAGNIAYVAPDPVAVEEPTRMGGSGAWLIPLVIVAVLALALTSNSASEAEEIIGR